MRQNEASITKANAGIASTEFGSDMDRWAQASGYKEMARNDLNNALAV